MKSNMYKSMFELENTHWYFRAKRDIVLTLVQLFSAGRSLKIADFGCGSGAMLNKLVKYGEVVGIDSSKEAIDLCKKNFPGTLIQSDIQNVNIPGRFNMITALDVLEHVDDERISIQSINKNLTTGGHCILTVPAFQFLWTNHDINCMHKRRYTKRSLLTLLDKSGFKVVYLSYFNFWLFPFIFGARKVISLLQLDHTSELEHKINNGLLNSFLYYVFSSEKAFIKRRIYLPFGVSIICEVEKEN